MQGFLGFNITSVKQTADKLKISVETLYGSLLLFAQGAKKAGAETQGLQRYINSLGSAIHNLDPQRAKKLAMAIGDIQRVSYNGVEFDVRIPNGKEISAFVKQNVPRIEDKSTPKNNSDSSQKTYYGFKEFKQEAKNANISLKQFYGTLLLFAQEAKKAKLNVDGLQLGLQHLGKRFAFDSKEAKEAAEKISQLQTVEYDGVKIQTKAPQTVNVVQQVEKIDKAWQKSGKTADDSRQKFIKQADQIGTSADRAIMAIDSVSGAFGGASTGLSGVVGDVIQLIKNPMTAAIAMAGVALTGIVALGKKMWDQWNESIQEATTKANFLADIASKKQQQGEENKDFNSGLIDRLKVINKDGILNELQNTEAIIIIDQLIKKLVELGNKEDDLRKKIRVENGKILGLDIAEIKLAVGATKQAIKLAQQNTDAKVQVATKSFNQASKPLSGYSFFNRDSESSYASNKIRTAEDIRNFRFDAKDTYSHVYNDGTIVNFERDKNQVEFEKKWNALMQQNNLQGILDLLAQKYQGVKTGSAIQQIQNLYNAIEALNKQQEKLNMLSKTGAKDQNQYFAMLSKQTRQYQDNVKGKTQSKKAEYEKDLNQFNDQKANDSLSEIEKYNFDSDSSMYLSEQIRSAEQDLNQFIPKLAQAKKKRDQLLKKANEKTKSGKPLTQAQIIAVRQASDAYIKLFSQRTTAENKVIELKQKQLQIDKRIYETQQKTAKFIKDKIQSAKDSIRLKQAEVRGDWGTFNNIKLNQQEQQSGVVLSEAQRKKILKAEAVQRAFDVKADMRSKVQDLYYSALGGKQADKQRMYSDYENKKQGKLTKAQIGAIDKIVDLQYALKNTPKLDLSNAQVKTNELTSRGGWKGGAVAPNVDRINQLIASNTQTANGILSQIKQVLSSGLKI